MAAGHGDAAWHGTAQGPDAPAAARPARPVPREAAARAGSGPSADRCRGSGRLRRTTPPGSYQPVWAASVATGLERLDLLGLRAFGPLAGGVFDPLVLLQAAVTFGLDGGLVNEDVVGAVVRGDETVPPVGAEPFHSALSHVPSPGETIFGGARGRDPSWRGPPAGKAWL